MTQRPPSRILRIVLLVSLALNLLVVGTLVGSALSGRGLAPPPRVDFSFGPIGRALDDETRRTLSRSVREREGFRGEGRQARRAQLEQIVAVLTADPFDPDQLSAVFEAQRSRGIAALAIGHEALVAQIAEMTPEARRALADRLENEAIRGHGDPAPPPRRD
ncbi:periplasmic heavy metal sensor [Roseisalinus antarcticus]|uniref:Periplasmic heavy metal sensor n=1 Tax=Roseisalinus antarcticus TaxID=254357 RepID=A0A1Y5S239_9RHOB|nr:periplasmic heavy metal sensor [Roseisalinus antarcticus]SLN28209.1 hypothetical protein ROA7023_00943 [Roseisalinus antarcticus]